jgi:formaldehyde-activating enzyme involved in methanogenesis
MKSADSLSDVLVNVVMSACIFIDVTSECARSVYIVLRKKIRENQIKRGKKGVPKQDEVTGEQKASAGPTAQRVYRS